MRAEPLQPSPPLYDASIVPAFEPVSSWRVVNATIVKELQIAKRYLPDLLGRVVDLSVRILFFMMLSKVMSVNSESSPLGHSMSGRELMVFFQGALTLFVFNTTALSSPVNAVNRDLYSGTLEYVYTNPISRYSYYVGTVLANAMISQVVFLPVFAVLVIYARTSLINTVAILLVCLVVLVTAVSLGVMIALMAILWRQIGSIASVLSILFEVLAGAYFPIMALPTGFRYLSFLLPYTWGYDLVRYYSFDGRWRTIYSPTVEWGILAIFALAFTLLSRFLLRMTERRAKQNGLHLL